MNNNLSLQTYRKQEKRKIRLQAINDKMPVFIIKLIVSLYNFLKWAVYFFVQREYSRKIKIFPKTRYKGFCPCCSNKTVFMSTDLWFRDSLRCCRCNSLPRDRQVFKYVNKLLEQRNDLRVLEFAPLPGAYMYKKKTQKYVISHYLPDKKFGKMDASFYNEDIQKTTFSDSSFDLIIHEDVLEHINDPLAAILDNFRILSDNGEIVFTCPVSSDKTVQRATVDSDGKLIFHLPPCYHGNPINNNGSLVFWEFGYDFTKMLKKTLPENADLKHIRVIDESMGIDGEMLDLFCIKKLPCDY